MEKYSIIDYIRNAVDDDYALEVLYFSIKRAIIKNDNDTCGFDRVKISGRFIEEAPTLILDSPVRNSVDAMLLLMSIRALMLDDTLFAKIQPGHLLFSGSKFGNNKWLQEIPVLLDSLDDDEFAYILGLAIKLASNIIDDESYIEEFTDRIAIPEFKNLDNFYQKKAKQANGSCKYVIANNAFVDDDWEQYVISEVIEYVGNTAFAYCNQLETIIIESDEVKFGRFPIIECPRLKHIVVPEDAVDYYKKALPYYKNIICSEIIKESDEQKTPEPIITESTVNLERRGAKWTPEEEKEIVEYFRAGFSFEDIAQHQGRTIVSIKARLGMLGEIDYRYEKGKEIIGVPYQVVREETLIEPQIIEEPEDTDDELEVEIDESKLYNVFKSKATSYKYFWLHAILSLIKEKGVLAYSYKELMIRMVARAWPLLKQDNLDFGKTDRLLNIIDNIKTHAVINGVTSDAIEMQISAQYDRNDLKRYIDQLGKNVPYRFLSPWIKYTSDGDVIAKSNDSQYATPYALYEDGIVIDEDWFDYFINNYDKVNDFIFFELYGYLKQYNEELKMTRFKFRKL